MEKPIQPENRWSDRVKTAVYEKIKSAGQIGISESELLEIVKTTAGDNHHMVGMNDVAEVTQDLNSEGKIKRTGMSTWHIKTP